MAALRTRPLLARQCPRATHRVRRLPFSLIGLKKCDSLRAELWMCGYAEIARRSRQTGKVNDTDRHQRR